jgi:hypothetical protein
VKTIAITNGPDFGAAPKGANELLRLFYINSNRPMTVRELMGLTGKTRSTLTDLIRKCCNLNLLTSGVTEKSSSAPNNTTEKPPLHLVMEKPSHNQRVVAEKPSRPLITFQAANPSDLLNYFFSKSPEAGVFDNNENALISFLNLKIKKKKEEHSKTQTVPSRRDSSRSLDNNRPSRSDSSISALEATGYPDAFPTFPIVDIGAHLGRQAIRELAGLRKISNQQYKDHLAEEQECAVNMHLHYFKQWGHDPVVRTISYGRELTKVLGYSGKAMFADPKSEHWHQALAGRRMADKSGARYEEWCQAIVKHYEDNPLPNGGVVKAGHFKTPKAWEHYQAWHAQEYEGTHPYLEAPVWLSEEYDPDCPMQQNYWRTFVELLTPRLGDGYRGDVGIALMQQIQNKFLTIEIVETYAPELVEVTQKRLNDQKRLHDIKPTEKPKPFCFGQFNDMAHKCMKGCEYADECELAMLQAARAPGSATIKAMVEAGHYDTAPTPQPLPPSEAPKASPPTTHETFN